MRQGVRLIAVLVALVLARAGTAHGQATAMAMAPGICDEACGMFNGTDWWGFTCLTGFPSGASCTATSSGCEEGDCRMVLITDPAGSRLATYVPCEDHEGAPVLNVAAFADFGPVADPLSPAPVRRTPLKGNPIPERS